MPLLLYLDFVFISPYTRIQAIPKNKNEEIIKALRQKETEVEALQKK